MSWGSTKMSGDGQPKPKKCGMCGRPIADHTAAEVEECAGSAN